MPRGKQISGSWTDIKIRDEVKKRAGVEPGVLEPSIAFHAVDR